MKWMPPKIDWSKDDYYNFEDLNRVENNTEVVEELVKLFETIPKLEIIKDRDILSIEFADSLNRIENNIDILGKRRELPGWIPNKLDWEYNQKFSYVDANRLERNLKILYEYYKKNSSMFKYCGMSTCGEEVI
ncbi:hypothetical protein [Tissierella sp.]|uniref:hypothetical protein n=1 Tax=Tissierella sp. TaxID=41274 RepID=UPI0030372D5A